MDSREEAKALRQSNLAFAFSSLEPARKVAMCAFYAFCRLVDDIVDCPESAPAEKLRRLSHWRAEIEGAYAGEAARSPLGQRMHDLIREYEVPPEPLQALFDGLGMDVQGRTYETAGDLREYCYGVASAVGLVSIRLFGCTHPDTRQFAIELGYALQMTNILRDVVDDYRRFGRVYLPMEELRQTEVQPEYLDDPDRHPQCVELFRLQFWRATHHFARARRFLRQEDRPKLLAALCMEAFYKDILHRIEARGFRLGGASFRLSRGRKLRLMWRCRRQLRQPWTELAPPQDVVVAGAGVAGISAAVALSLDGHRVSLLEAKETPGGRARSLVDRPSGLLLDNGQHLVMGCYKAFFRTLRALGTLNQIRIQSALNVPFSLPDGSSARLRSVPQLSPAHLLAALLRFRALGWADRVRAIRLAWAVRRPGSVKRGESAASWLNRYGQGSTLRESLWEPFCLAALNEPLDEASAHLLRETLRRSLFGSVAESAIGFPNGPLSSLFLPALPRLLGACGGVVRTRARITAIDTDGALLKSLSLADGTEVEAGAFVLALPWHSLRGLLSPEAGLAQRLQRIQGSPILGAHLLCRQPFTEEPFVGLVGSALHWVFDRSDLLSEDQRTAGLHLYAAVVSSAREWVGLSPPQSEERVLAALECRFPRFSRSEVLACRVLRFRDATCSSTQGAETIRASLTSPWSNAVFAGDWTHPGLPGTLESAAESGWQAARLLEGSPAV